MNMHRSDSLPAFSRDWALFLDVDGTLLELADRPENVIVEPQIPALLETLAEGLDGAVALITGRELSVLDDLLGMPDLAAAGLHGIEWRLSGEGDRTRVRTVDHAFLERFRRKLEPLSERYPALQVEDKRLSLAVHFRQAPHLRGQVEAAVHAALDEAHAESGRPASDENDFHLMRGHMVAEIKSRRANKGYALEAFMRHTPFRGRVPVFLGDDVTDEDGFAAVNALEGLSIKVGNGDTRARFRIHNPGEVLEWLGAYRDFLYA